MTAWIVTPAGRPLRGQAELPGDKSIAHRALLLSALCRGPVVVTGLGAGADNRRTARAMQQLGVQMTAGGDALRIHGVGLRGLRAPADAGTSAGGAAVIDCGNSGTTMRLLAGLLAAQPFESVLIGDESLTRRPMRRVAAPLAEMGARIRGAGPAGRDAGDDAPVEIAGDVYPPLVIGPCPAAGLVGIEHRMAVASAQVKSALLLAGLYAGGVTRVIEPGAARDHTERMLAHMGAPVRVRPADTTDIADAAARAGTATAVSAVSIDPTGWDGALACDAIDVPRDPSQAAFAIAAAVVVGADRVVAPGVCVNPTRTGFLDVLAAMGARIECVPRPAAGGEPVADLIAARQPDELACARVAGDVTVRAIDEIPILAVVAARARGETRFDDAAELRVKESDRIATTAAMLRALGAHVEDGPDWLVVRGDPGRAFRGARIDACGDHRIAMAGAVAGACAAAPVRIDGVECVDTSFPGFARVIGALGVDIRTTE